MTDPKTIYRAFKSVPVNAFGATCQSYLETAGWTSELFRLAGNLAGIKATPAWTKVGGGVIERESAEYSGANGWGRRVRVLPGCGEPRQVRGCCAVGLRSVRGACRYRHQHHGAGDQHFRADPSVGALMADRKPLVLSSDGTTEQLQAGDRLVDADGATLGGGTGAAADYVQDTLLGLTEGDSGAAISATNPKTVSRLLNVTSQFLVRPVLVLKLETGATGVTRTVCSFNLVDVEQFAAVPYVQFSGTVSPATAFTLNATQVGTTADGKNIFRTLINRPHCRSIQNITVV